MTNSKTTKRSLAMQYAHQLWKKGIFNKDWGKCQSFAWYIVRLKFRMKDEVLKITYRGKDGKLRERLATLKAEYLPEFKGTSTGKKMTSTKVTYFDIEKNSFRSFLAENISSYSFIKEPPIFLRTNLFAFAMIYSFSSSGKQLIVSSPL